jgi:hypothetical protein
MHYTHEPMTGINGHVFTPVVGDEEAFILLRVCGDMILCHASVRRNAAF